MSITPNFRIVLDTNTVIGAGSRWLAEEHPRPVSIVQRLVHTVASSHVGLYCESMLDEYVEVMRRRNHPEDRIAKFLAFVISLFTKVIVTSTACHTLPSDPDDVIFLFCALDGDADLLISDDKHLLSVRAAYLPRPNIVRVPEACLHLQLVGDGVE